MLAIPVGLLASAILVVNNVRDLETDRRAGKRTLAVRLGRDGARGLYGGMLLRRVRDRADAVAVRRRRARRRGCCCRGWRSRSRCRSRRSCASAPTGRRSTARSPRPGCSSWCSACCSPPGCSRAEPVAALAVETVRLPLRRAARDGLGHAARARAGAGAAALRRRRLGRGRGRAAGALRRRPARGGAAPRSTPTPRWSRAGPEDDAAALLEACRGRADLPQALAAIDLALWDRAGRRAGRPVAALLGGDAAEPVAVNALVGAEDRAGAARRPAEAAAAGYSLREGQGRDRRRRRAGSRRCAPRSGPAWRSAPTPTAPGARRARRSPTCARSPRSGSSCARSRCTGSRRCARCARSRRCRSRSTRARPSRARRAPARPTRSA